MKCSYGASVAEPAGRVWASLTDVDAVLSELPGAGFVRDGDEAAGSLKCVVGSSQITYRLSARIDLVDAASQTATIAVTGKEARGSGILAATVTVSVHDRGSDAQVNLSGDIAATGRAEAADADAWAQLLGKLLAAVLPSPVAAAPVAEPMPPRPALAVAPTPAPGEFPLAELGRPARRPQVMLGLAAAGLLFVVRRLRARGGRRGRK